MKDTDGVQHYCEVEIGYLHLSNVMLGIVRSHVDAEDHNSDSRSIAPADEWFLV